MHRTFRSSRRPEFILRALRQLRANGLPILSPKVKPRASRKLRANDLHRLPTRMF
jgi:hypothetical protein